MTAPPQSVPDLRIERIETIPNLWSVNPSRAPRPSNPRPRVSSLERFNLSTSRGGHVNGEG